MKNGDRVRQMSDQELVKVVKCPGRTLERCKSRSCSECKLEWMTEESEE